MTAKKRPAKPKAPRSPRDKAIASSLSENYDEYVDLLPLVQLARCPFTNDVASISIDDAGIDGPWWDYISPVRGEDDLPPTFFCLTGSLKLNGDPENTEFLVKPGPEVPFVVPGILERDNIKAVLSHIKIGKHDGHAVTYFAQPIPTDVGRFNTWGMDRSWYEGAEEPLVYYEVNEDFEPIDFELRPWIERQKLYWIAPGDKKLRLRSEVDGCPYLDLEGRRTFIRIQYGQVWEPDIPEGVPG